MASIQASPNAEIHTTGLHRDPLIALKTSGLQTAHANLLEANREFDAIDGSDAAAQAQQEAEELIARIARHARTYARTRLAEVIVSRVVQVYRERH